ncbi:MAG TPA: uracil-DNA glycosylase [Planctomycetaceae bacterium]|nr:uracil-DNA glycosylase [Blastopirellula sp.]HAY81006.1 uracil-DNA glycosylase [Planctomycetaceae bacterium]
MENMNHAASGVSKALVQRLRALQQAGVQQLPRTTSTAPKITPENRSSSPIATTPVVAGGLEGLAAEVAACTLCHELATTRTQTVFGVGNPRAELCFLGEAPGADEDRQGEPFVGRAGMLLTDIIQKGMKLRRQDVYILNILKCRPPGNRNPAGDEVAHCRPFFERQLEIIQPKFICCLGSVAAQNLLETNVSVGRLRGKLHDWQGHQVLVTYHPAYLLRNPAAKKDTWEDIQLLMEAMGLKS